MRTGLAPVPRLQRSDHLLYWSPAFAGWADDWAGGPPGLASMALHVHFSLHVPPGSGLLRMTKGKWLWTGKNLGHPNGALQIPHFVPNEQNVPEDRRAKRLAFSRRIPGLKREAWGTHRVSRWNRFEVPALNESDASRSFLS